MVLQKPHRRVGEAKVEAAMIPTGKKDLTPPVTAGPIDTALDMGTPAIPVLTPRKATSQPTLVPTSWTDSSPTRTGQPTRPPEAPGQM
jgi:hypothetical protein